MKWCTIHSRWALLLAALFSGVFSTYISAVPVIQRSAIHKAEPEKLQEVTLPVDHLQLFIEVMQRIKGAYVDTVDDKVLMTNAIRGMIQGLDSHSAFLESEQLQQLKENTIGQFAGIGVEVDIKSEGLFIMKVFPQTPAYKSGILPEDKVTHLNDFALNKLLPKEIFSLMRGRPGSEIKMTIERKNINKPLHFAMKRELIQINSVKHRRLLHDIGYIRISQFSQNTAIELARSLIELEKTHPVNGLILDLRDNPGGVLQAAVDVVDIFIEKGRIVSTAGRVVGSDLTFNAKQSDLTHGLPLAVLINSYSASASEIVAGALQDHNRAIILGNRSYGKGSVQSVLPLFSTKKPSGLKLTTARYYTPEGRSIQSTGIVPDIKINAPHDTTSEEDFLLIKASAILRSTMAKSDKILTNKVVQ